jgi:chromosome partitioning protein
MKVTICNGKGGTGKTTVTMEIGMALSEVGHKVGLLDLDPQKTATKWAGLSTNLEPIKRNGEYSIILVDTPPRLDSKELHRSLWESDVIVLVTSPSPADLWASKETSAVIAQHARSDCKVRILFNQVQKNTKLAGELDFMAELSNLFVNSDFVSGSWSARQSPLGESVQTLFYCTLSEHFFQISADLTLHSLMDTGIPPSYDRAQFTVSGLTIIPEPSTSLLIAIGFGALFLYCKSLSKSENPVRK